MSRGGFNPGIRGDAGPSALADAIGLGGNLSRVVGAVKNVTAHQLGRRLWQAGFHDHGVRAEEDLRSMARYIVANPLRAGLVERLGDYPHWDARWL